MDDENVIKGGIGDWVEDIGTISQTTGWELGIDIDLIPVFGERNKLVVGSLVDGERERVGVVDVAVSSVEGKGDLAVAVK